MPSITNVGGSLTTAVALTFLAWSVRALRAAALRGAASRCRTPAARKLRQRLHATMSLAALRVLDQLDAVPHVVVDTRDAWNDQESQSTNDAIASKILPRAKDGQPNPILPDAHRSVLYLREDQLEEAFGCDEDEWNAKWGTKKPESEHVIAFVAHDTWRAQACAAQVASLGFFSCVAIRDGGTKPSTVQYVHRHSVAEALLRKANRFVLIDVRRHDERILYGSPKGSFHLPVEQLPRALSMSEDEFLDTFGFEKPAKQDVVVLICRSNRRARWAFQLMADAGYQLTFVCREGTSGWRLEHDVLPYRSYELGEPPPDPEPFDVEEVDLNVAEKELQMLGIVCMG